MAEVSPSLVLPQILSGEQISFLTPGQQVSRSADLEKRRVSHDKHVAVGTVEVGAHTALLTLCVFIYMAVPFGIATAATIRVGNVRLSNIRSTHLHQASAMLSATTTIPFSKQDHWAKKVTAGTEKAFLLFLEGLDSVEGRHPM